MLNLSVTQTYKGDQYVLTVQTNESVDDYYFSCDKREGLQEIIIELLEENYDNAIELIKKLEV